MSEGLKAGLEAKIREILDEKIVEAYKGESQGDECASYEVDLLESLKIKFEALLDGYFEQLQKLFANRPRCPIGGLTLTCKKFEDWFVKAEKVLGLGAEKKQ